MAKVLITGGTGFIGSHLSVALVRQGHTVTALSRAGAFSYPQGFSDDEQRSVRVVRGNICDRDLLASEVGNADVLFHKAAAVGVAESAQRVRDFMETNVLGTATLVDVLKAGHHNVKTVILGSSISVYGEGNYDCRLCGVVRPDIRIGSATFETTGDWNPRCVNCDGHLDPTWTPEKVERRGESIYAISKKTQEDLLISTCRLLGLRLVVLRYCTVFGPGQPQANPYTRFLRLMLDGDSPTLTEDGLQSRDFIYIDDVVRVNLKAIESNLPGVQIFNVGSTVQTPLISFVKTAQNELAGLLGEKIKDCKVSQRLVPGEIRHCQVDCTAMSNTFDIRSWVGLDEGVHKLAQWFVESRLLKR